jgi:hypothetical protein
MIRSRIIPSASSRFDGSRPSSSTSRPYIALNFGRHVVEDTRTGGRYRIYRGEVKNAMHTPVVAWAITPDGPVFLEPV